MSEVAFPAALRAAYLARIADNLRGVRAPGGDLAAWLAPLPTAALAEVLIHPPARTAEILFAAIGMWRTQANAGLPQNLFDGAPDNIPRGPTADAALRAWATCRLAQSHLACGLPGDAQRALYAAARHVHLWPTPIAQRFEPQIVALYAAAERMRARQLAEEVA